MGDGRSGGGNPPPAVGATLIAAAMIVLVIGFGWLNSRGSAPAERLTAPMVDGVTLPVDDEGDPVDVPPSQPATPVSFGPGGEILRPDPVRARVVDESGDEMLVPLSPNTTVDTVTGEIVPTTTATTRRPGSSSTSPTTRPATTATTSPPSSPTTTPTTSPTTSPTTTTTTAPTTTQPPTTEPPPTTAPPTTDPPEDPGLLDGVVDALLP
ncbi:MAG TPA: hypothetical protein VFZ79_15530 [Acidimicrobiales bacterium]